MVAVLFSMMLMLMFLLRAQTEGEQRREKSDLVVRFPGQERSSADGLRRAFLESKRVCLETREAARREGTGKEGVGDSPRSQQSYLQAVDNGDQMHKKRACWKDEVGCP